MKANELRIGNWVKLKDSDPIENYQISQIYERGVNSGSVGMLYEIIEPIPLTEEWLVKFGFKKTYSELTYKEYDFKKFGVEINSDIMTVSYNYGNNVEWVNFTHIKHVHTLQNFYHALTGEELELKP